MTIGPSPRAVLAAILALLAATSRFPAQKVLRVAHPGPVGSLDPHLGGERPHAPSDFRLHAQMFESPLSMALDAGGRGVLGPGVCDLPSVSEDGMTLVFSVRPGHRFADHPAFSDGVGREVSAADIVFSLLRHADPKAQSHFYAPFLEGLIEGLDAWRAAAIREGFADFDASVRGLSAEGTRVTMRLTRPVPQFQGLLTQPWAAIVPFEVIRRVGTGFGDRPCGSGPFVFAERDPLGSVRLMRNPRFGPGAPPALDEVRFVVAPSAQALVDRFLGGELEVMELFDAAMTQRFLTPKGELLAKHRSAGYRSVPGVGTDVSYLVPSFRHKFLGKVAVRRALLLALDRDAHRLRLLGPRAALANAPFPPIFPETVGLSKDASFVKPDLEAARRALAQAGHPEGQGLPEMIFDVPNASDADGSLGVARDMIADWARVGLHFQLRTPSMDEFLRFSSEGQVQLAWLGWFADYPDVENFLRLFWSEETRFNYGRYHNVRVDELFADISVRQPSRLRTTLVSELVDLVRADVAWIPLWYPSSIAVTRPEVSGYRPNPWNWSLAGADLGKSRR